VTKEASDQSSRDFKADGGGSGELANGPRSVSLPASAINSS